MRFTSFKSNFFIPIAKVISKIQISTLPHVNIKKPLGCLANVSNQILQIYVPIINSEIYIYIKVEEISR